MSFFGRSGRTTGKRGEDVPEANPDTPPDSSDPTGRCPRCRRSSNFTKVGDLPVSLGGGGTQGPDGRFVPDTLDQVSALVCSGCSQGTAVVEEKWIGDHPAREGIGSGGTITFRGIHWWPPPGGGDLDPAIPKVIREAYTEGLKALGVQAPRAAAVMFRRTMEAIVKDKGGPAAQSAVEKNLASGLSEMVKEGSLDSNLADWAKEVRTVGNAGAHFDPIKDVKQEEAESLAKLLRSLFDYLYEAPARIQRTRSSGTP